MTIEIKVNDKVRTVTEGELKLLRELGVDYTSADHQTEAFVVATRRHWSQHRYWQLTDEERATRRAEFEAKPLYQIVKVTNLRFIKYKYGKDWNRKFDLPEDFDGDFEVNTYWGFFKTEGEAQMKINAQRGRRELEKQHEEAEQVIQRQLDELRRANRDKIREYEKANNPTPISLTEEVPHYKSDQPDSTWGTRYTTWKAKTGGKETLTLVGRFD